MSGLEIHDQGRHRFNQTFANTQSPGISPGISPGQVFKKWDHLDKHYTKSNLSNIIVDRILTYSDQIQPNLIITLQKSIRPSSGLLINRPDGSKSSFKKSNNLYDQIMKNCNIPVLVHDRYS